MMEREVAEPQEKVTWTCATWCLLYLLFFLSFLSPFGVFICPFLVRGRLKVVSWRTRPGEPGRPFPQYSILC